MASIACICPMVMEHCITWSSVTSASPASAHNAIASTSAAVMVLRILVLRRMLEGLFFVGLARQSVMSVTLASYFDVQRPEMYCRSVVRPLHYTVTAKDIP